MLLFMGDCIYAYTHTHIYIYIYRERERERERQTDRQRDYYYLRVFHTSISRLTLSGFWVTTRLLWSPRQQFSGQDGHDFSSDFLRSFFSKPSGTVPDVPTTIYITVNLMFQSAFFYWFVRSKYFYISLLSFIFTLCFAGMAKLTW